MPQPHPSAPDTDLDPDRLVAATLADGGGDPAPGLHALTALWRAPDHARASAEVAAATDLLTRRIQQAHHSGQVAPLPVVTWVGTHLGTPHADRVRTLRLLDPASGEYLDGPFRLPCLLWYTAGMIASTGRDLDWWHRLSPTTRDPAPRIGLVAQQDRPHRPPSPVSHTQGERNPGGTRGKQGEHGG